MLNMFVQRFSRARISSHNLSRAFSQVSPQVVQSPSKVASQSVRSISFYDTTLEQYASKELKRVTIRQMIEFCQGKVTPEKLLLSARYVHDELPKRLARRLMDLRTLPYIIITNPYVKRVYEIYVQAFDRIRNFPKIETLEEEARFTLLLKEIVLETTQVVDLLAKGTSEATKKVPRSRLNLDSFLENMLLSRIGRRVLAEQHVLYHKPQDSGYVGVINPRCNIAHCVKAAVNQASSVCHNTYGSVPTVEFKGSLAANIPYISAHLEFVCFEILKNSMRAVVEQKIKDGILFSHSTDSAALPDVEILIAEGPEQTTIRISDRGGGLSPESAAEAFQFGFTTATMNDPGNGFGNQFLMQNDHSPMAGLGFGLPLARLYTRHFGGDLELVSMYGYGTDVYIRLDRTGNQVEKVEI